MQGQSEYTTFKQARFHPIFIQSLRISKAESVRHWPYYHIDLNAGSGFNEDHQVEGSPLNFLRALGEIGRSQARVFLVDKDADCIAKLIQRSAIQAYADRIGIFHGDNAEILDVVSHYIIRREPNPQFAMGTIVIDPNGYHTGVPWEALKIFCRQYRRFDLIFNLNVRQFRLERPHIEAGKKGWANKRLMPLSEFPQWFSRQHWMWTDLCQIKGSTWIQCVGRTIKTIQDGYPQIGFYDSQSLRGQAVLQRIIEDQKADVELPFLSEL